MAQLQLKQIAFDTFEEFLDWERDQEFKHELLDGIPVGMAGANEGHNVIQGNIFATALARLRGTPCRAFGADMAVKTGTARGRYPDVTIDCGPRNPAHQSAPQPTVVFEVLSQGTRTEDFTSKLWEYNSVVSIAHYVLVEPAEPKVYVYSRSQAGEFIVAPVEIRGLNGALELPAVNLRMTLMEIYEGLEMAA